MILPAHAASPALRDGEGGAVTQSSVVSAFGSDLSKHWPLTKTRNEK
jgi:hypothetical protein